MKRGLCLLVACCMALTGCGSSGGGSKVAEIDKNLSASDVVSKMRDAMKDAGSVKFTASGDDVNVTGSLITVEGKQRGMFEGKVVQEGQEFDGKVWFSLLEEDYMKALEFNGITIGSDTQSTPTPEPEEGDTQKASLYVSWDNKNYGVCTAIDTESDDSDVLGSFKQYSDLVDKAELSFTDDAYVLKGSAGGSETETQESGDGTASITTITPKLDCTMKVDGNFHLKEMEITSEENKKVKVTCSDLGSVKDDAVKVPDDIKNNAGNIMQFLSDIMSSASQAESSNDGSGGEADTWGSGDSDGNTDTWGSGTSDEGSTDNWGNSTSNFGNNANTDSWGSETSDDAGSDGVSGYGNSSSLN